MKHTIAILSTILFFSCTVDDVDTEADSDDEAGDVEFRAVGDNKSWNDVMAHYGAAYCREFANDKPDHTRCRASQSGAYVDRVVCMPCSPDADSGWIISGFGLPTAWVNNGMGTSEVMCTGLAVVGQNDVAWGSQWILPGKLINDECNNADTTNAGVAGGPICLPHPGSDGCAAAAATSYQIDGGAAALCCNGEGECVQPTTNTDTCFGDPANDGYTTLATCVPCEGFEPFMFTGQSTGVDDECNFGNPCGGWDLLNTLGHNLHPSGSEWGGSSISCIAGNGDMPETYAAAVGVADCHWAVYQCGGMLMEAVDGLAGVIEIKCNL